MSVVFAFSDATAWLDGLEAAISATRGKLALHRYPDREVGVRLDTPVAGEEVVLAAALHQPNAKLLPLLFAADAARDLGAKRVGLVAPYLPYLRQDRRFAPGEAITSQTFARVLSSTFDWLVTVDPHLHRYPTLDSIYSIPSAVARAAPLIGAWIAEQADRPLIVGPDSESEQWVSEVATFARAPFVVLEKTRRGDRDVAVSVPQVSRWHGRTPVLVDDIVSTARTMIETIGHLRRLAFRAPMCVGVHAIFADTAYDQLQAAGAARIVTCNTVAHLSNAIDVGPAIGSAVARLMSGESPIGEDGNSQISRGVT